MAESEDILPTEMTASKPKLNMEVSHAEEYLHLLLERERECNELKQKEVESEQVKAEMRNEIAMLRNELLSLKEEVRMLLKENADLHTTLEKKDTSHPKALSTPMMPLMIASASPDSETDETPPPIRAARRKQYRIEQEVIERLKNNRKAYPVVCPKALEYWQKLGDADLIDEKLRPKPRCTVTVAARIVCRMQTLVDPNITWAFFEKYWKMSHLQSNMKREADKCRQLYGVVNQIFGLPADAPYTTKSKMAV